MDKTATRQRIMAIRNHLTAPEREIYSQNIYEQLLQLDLFKNSNVIASFVDFREEVSMTKINTYILNSGKTLVLPYVDFKRKEMTFHIVNDLSTLHLSRYGIREPNPNLHSEIDIADIEIVLTPGVAFDKNGYRLGYGGGFYDRFFATIDSLIPKIGIAYSLQLVDSIPVESHDKALDGIVTEKGLTQFKSI